MIVLIAYVQQQFLWNQSLSQLQGRGILQECERKEIKVTPKSITHKQTDIFTQSYQKETDDQLKAIKERQKLYFQ